MKIAVRQKQFWSHDIESLMEIRSVIKIIKNRHQIIKDLSVTYICFYSFFIRNKARNV